MGDEILAVPELDFLCIGPTDLSASMGYVGQLRHPEVVKATEEAGQRIMAAGKATGTLILSMDEYSFWRERGFQIMITVAQTFFMDGAKAMRDHSHLVEAALQSG